MLKVDLGQLARKQRLLIDAHVPPRDELFEGVPFTMREPLAVQLEAQQSGSDVLVRGTLRGEAELACRRCLIAIANPIEEDVALLYRAGVSEAEAEDAEVYPLPEQGHELDLADALREALVLAVPDFAICSETCQGLCPSCGANWNETKCSCESAEVDNRWAALRKVK